jgi:carbon storage regulator
MLVLRRKRGEQILVPDCELAVTVLAVEGKTVRLGISAPPDLAVYREEVWHKVSQQLPGRPFPQDLLQGSGGG